MNQIAIRIVTISLLLSGITYLKTGAQPVRKITPQQQAFERVFGDAARLDTAMIRKVKADKPGKRHYVDRDGDGKPEEVWFIDIDPRHTTNKRPILVRAIDEDNDMVTGKEPDLDSDLYVADWNADGTVDAVVDYKDVDGDQDVDEMALYSYGKFGNTECLQVWWSRDDGDDNLLWYNVDYRYYQRPCQDYSHFGGDESFSHLYLTPEADIWMPSFENPFLFFDRDSDGVTEEVIRVEGRDEKIEYVRWSFDADNDATTAQPRDFDVTIAACAPGWTDEKKRESDFNFHVDKEHGEILTIRGIPTAPILRRTIVSEYLKDITWARVQLTWDENDLNIAGNPVDTFERWEGIIAPEYNESGFYFPRIGGPVCNVFNKRTEIVLHPTGPNEFYFKSGGPPDSH